MQKGFVTIGEYLARMDVKRKGCPLTQLLLRGKVSEESLDVLPAPYAIVKPLTRLIMPSLIASIRLVGVDVASSEDIVVMGHKAGQIFYLDEVKK